MPFKTPCGSHYHMTEGCCNAFIQCDTKGLEPCAICCGGAGGAATGSGAVAGVGSPVSGDASGSYGLGGVRTPSPDEPVVTVRNGDEEILVPISKLGLSQEELEHQGRPDEPFLTLTNGETELHVPISRLGLTMGDIEPHGTGGAQRSRPADVPQGRPMSQSHSPNSQLPAKPSVPSVAGNGIDASPKPELDASAELRDQIVQAMVDAFAKQGATMDYPQPVVKQAVADYARMQPDVTGQSAMSAPQTTAPRLLSTPHLARATLTLSDATLDWGLRHNSVPAVRKLGSGLRDALGFLQLSVRNGIRSQRHDRQLRRTMRQNECDDYSARCILALERERHLEHTQRSASEYIQRQMRWSNAGAGGRQVTYDDVVMGSIGQIARRTMDDYGIRASKTMSVDQTISLARILHYSIEEGGYADKITPGLIERVRRERGLAPDEADALTIAMDRAMRSHQFRTVTARDIVARLRP